MTAPLSKKLNYVLSNLSTSSSLGSNTVGNVIVSSEAYDLKREVHKYSTGHYLIDEISGFDAVVLRS